MPQHNEDTATPGRKIPSAEPQMECHHDSTEDATAAAPSQRIRLLDGSWSDALPPAKMAELLATAWTIGSVVLEDFIVEDRFDTGGMGLVYKVRSRQTGERFAAKRTRLRGPQEMRDFFIEIQTWIDLPDHPHLTAFRFFRTAAEEVVIFSEFLDGGTLGAWIRERKLTQLAQILDVAIQLAWGLSALHEYGLLHQDVKPDNVLMTPDGTVKLADFGLARASAMTRDAESVQAAPCNVSYRGMTRAYCSPQQERIRQAIDLGTPSWKLPKLTRQTDIWSWGLCVLEMFAGGRTWAKGPEAQRALQQYLAQARPSVGTLLAMPSEIVELLTECFQSGDDIAEHTVSMEAAAETLCRVYEKTTKSEYVREVPTSFASSDVSITGFERLTTTGVSYPAPSIYLQIAFREAGRNPLDVEHIVGPGGCRRRSKSVRDVNICQEARRIFENLVAQGRDDLEQVLAETCQVEGLARDYSEDVPGALTVLHQAVEILERLVCQRRRDDLQEKLATALTNEAVTLHRRGDLVAADSLYQRAVSAYRALIVDQKRVDLEPALAGLYLSMAGVPRFLGNPKEALNLLDQAICILSRVSTPLPPGGLASLFGRAWLNRANVLREMGEMRAALDAADCAIRPLEQAMHKGNLLGVARVLGSAYDTKGITLAANGSHRGALEYFQKALAIREKLVKEHGLEELASDLALTYMQTGVAFNTVGITGEAVRCLEISIRSLEHLVRRLDRRDLLVKLALAHENKGVALGKSGHAQEALTELQQAIILGQEAVARQPNTQCLGILAHAFMNAGMFSCSIGEHTKALAFLDQAIDVLTQLVTQCHVQVFVPQLGQSRVYRAVCFFNLGKRDQATREAGETLSMLQREVVRTRRKDFQEAINLAIQALHVFKTAK